MADESRAQVAAELLKSLDSAIKTVLSEDLKSLREAIKSAEASFLQRLVQSENSNARAIDALRNDLNARIAELTKRLESSAQDQERSLKEAEGRLAASAAQMDSNYKKSLSATDATVTVLRQTVAGDVAAARARADHEVDSVREELRGIAAHLEQHTGELQRVSTVLSGFARIFSGETLQAPSPTPAPLQPKASKPAAPMPAALPLSARKPPTAPGGKGGDGQDSPLPSSGDIVEGIDSMFKLKSGR
jgi:hypothetical protein